MFSLFNKIQYVLTPRQVTQVFFLLIGSIVLSIVETAGIGLVGIYVLALGDSVEFVSKIPFDFIKSYLSDLSKIKLFLVLSLVLVLSFILKNVYTLFYLYCESIVTKNILLNNSTNLYRIYLERPFFFHLKQNPQKIINKINTGVKMSVSYILFCLSLCKECMLIIFLSSALMLLSLKVSLAVFFSLLIISTFVYILIKKKLKSIGTNIIESNEAILKSLVEGIRGIKISKILNNYNFLISKYRPELIKREENQVAHSIFQKLPKSFLEIFGVFGICLLTIYLLNENMSDKKIFTFLSLLALVLIRLLPSFASISTSIANLRVCKAAFEELANEIKISQSENTNIESHKKNTSSKFDLSKFSLLRLSNIYFKYGSKYENVLTDISIDIKKNSITGFMGESGSGKTTLVDLIIGLLNPSSVSFEINGNNIRLFNLKEWQKIIGYVPQDIFLNNSTIKENIAYGVKADLIDEKKVKRCIQKVQLQSYLKSLPLGINEIISDMGKNMSGGQKQRIGIARALYNDAKILVLDEATSSLDYENEQKIMKDIKIMSKDVTILVIGHKFSSMRNCDKIYSMQSGKIVKLLLPPYLEIN